jgi:hypothetical protein
MPIQEGQRVRTRQLDRRTYARGAAEALSGLTGVVDGKPGRDGRHLVRFDAPAPTWWSYQTPPTAWWFDADELEAIE